ncbi:hypothetical protein MASR2M16_37120 [Thauera terpenica]
MLQASMSDALSPGGIGKGVCVQITCHVDLGLAGQGGTSSDGTKLRLWERTMIGGEGGDG